MRERSCTAGYGNDTAKWAAWRTVAAAATTALVRRCAYVATYMPVEFTIVHKMDELL
jgi:hypothetical protein